ncbi:MAG: PorP/SprF family type IX secretion system membrane protein [Bacteroidia bacterium]|nr:PorP/SprF family type IX secretion system membrane protein [Bacteroidia bacterium]
MKKIFLYFFLFASLFGFGQDPSFSQFYSNPLYLNPAFAGSNHDARIGGNYRNQWPRIPGKWVTYNVFGDIYAPPLMGGLGFIAMQDVSGEGLLSTSSVGIVQSFERPIPKIVRIRAGYNVSLVSKRIDWSKLTFSDQLDPTKGSVYQTAAIPTNGRTFVDFQAGFILDFPNFRIGHSVFSNVFGMSFNHLTQPNQSLTGGVHAPLPLKTTLHYNMEISVGQENPNEKSFYISPNFIYEKQNEYRTFNFGVYVTKDPLIAGMFFRMKKATSFKDNDALILYIGFKSDLTKHTTMRLGYSYDLTISGLAPNTMGAHEISLVFEWKNTNLRGKKSSRSKNAKRIDDCMDFGFKSLVF